MSRYNPYQQPDAVSEFLRGWQAVDVIRDSQEARQDRVAERQYRTERRAREKVVEGRADAEWDANAPLRDAQRRVALGTANEWENNAPVRDAQRRISLGEAEEWTANAPVRQAKRVDALDEAQTAPRRRRLTEEATVESIAGARETRRGARLKNDAMAELDQIDRQLAALSTGQFKALENPAYRQNAMDVYAELMSGKGISAPDKLYPLVNDTFADELQVGVGNPVAGTQGDIIAGKRIVGIYEDPSNPENVLLELDVTARKGGEEGQEYNYRAPVTKNRRSDDADEVRSIPKSMMMQRLEKVVGASLDIEQGGDINALRSQLQARRELLASRVPGARGAAGGGKRSAKVEYLDYVSQNVFGGDTKKAFEALEGGKVRAIAAQMAKNAFEAQAKSYIREGDPGYKTQDELYKDSLTLVERAAEEVTKRDPDEATDRRPQGPVTLEGLRDQVQSGELSEDDAIEAMRDAGLIQ